MSFYTARMSFDVKDVYLVEYFFFATPALLCLCNSIPWNFICKFCSSMECVNVLYEQTNVLLVSVL